MPTSFYNLPLAFSIMSTFGSIVLSFVSNLLYINDIIGALASSASLLQSMKKAKAKRIYFPPRFCFFALQMAELYLGD